MTTNKNKKSSKKIRYGVLGLGHIAQVAMLPGFKHANKNSELVALISDSASKATKIAKKYNVPHIVSYDEYDSFLETGAIDALYIALPNHMHHEFTIRALKKGVHVLCEKPMAITTQECLEMYEASQKSKTKLMIAYRLHFDPANLRAIEICHSKSFGDLIYFNSSFSFDVKDEDNIRLKKDLGGGTLWDIGIYCINAARYIFKDEPIEVCALATNSGRKRFSEVEETVAATLKFPHGKLANFICSFGSADSSRYEVFGTKGSLCLEEAYEYAAPRTLYWKLGSSKENKKKFSKKDQFGAELEYFSDCILHNKKVEPSSLEGLMDVKIIEALYQSLKEGRAISLTDDIKLEKKTYPTEEMSIEKPPVKKPEVIQASSPSGD